MTDYALRQLPFRDVRFTEINRAIITNQQFKKQRDAFPFIGYAVRISNLVANRGFEPLPFGRD